jgi:hypothetical protein
MIALVAELSKINTMCFELITVASEQNEAQPLHHSLFY